MDKIKYLAFITVLLFCFPVSAEYYKFTGPDGKESYTDDYNKVPKNQRAKVKGYTGYESDAGSSEPEIKQETEQGVDALELKDEKQGKNPESAKTENYDKARESLEKKKLELEDEHKALAKEREGLDLLKNELKTSEQTLQYNSRIQDHNEKIKTYSAKRKSFVSEAGSYNSEIEKSMKSELEKYNLEKLAEAESKEK
ncbi:MAG: hypothetical protein KKH97_01120 [Proteobacteria bacterium]|nr:hypothetical protein [Pseudomonadota bacterium]MBU1712079.1 hypothetical protein [Pseudomonadota bacterium]